MLDASGREWGRFRQDIVRGALMDTGLESVACTSAAVARASLLLSARTPRLGSRFGWVYPAATPADQMFIGRSEIFGIFEPQLRAAATMLRDARNEVTAPAA